ncbi:MAG TPA: hypothetical protein VHX38_15545 [Pseudonocardiaceae bacterium]|jgi:hypothetical protein|nr:hypothetical protein [Pseudonocardiaceae bacterium]
MSDGNLFTGLVHGVEDAVDTVGKGIENLIDDVTGSGAAPGTDTPLSDIRWEGMSNPQLAAAVQQLNDGSSASVMTQAADALANVAAGLAQINQTLQTQLQAIGVNWQSASASELADQMISASAAYGGSATDQGGQASTSINQQAEAYATARNAAPQPQTLLGNTQSGGNSLFANLTSPLTGHGNDQSQQANQTNAARAKAVDTLNNYTSASQSNLGSYSPPAPAPAIGVHTQAPPGGSSGVTVSGYVPPPSGAGSPGATGPSGGGTSLPPGVSGGGVGGGSQPPVGLGGLGAPGSVTVGGGSSGGGVPSGGGQSGLGFPGGLPTGLPGGASGGGVSGGGVPGGGGSSVGLPPGSPNLPTGPISGIGSAGGSGGGPSSAAMPGGGSGAGLGEDIGNFAGGAAVAGGAAAVGIVGANSEGDQVVKGRSGNEPGGFADDEDDFAPHSGDGDLAELDAGQATAARVNEQLSATEPAGPTLLEPAVGGGRRDDDAEHRNSYAADSADFFDDGRMVAPDVFGAADDEDA